MRKTAKATARAAAAKTKRKPKPPQARKIARKRDRRRPAAKRRVVPKVAGRSREQQLAELKRRLREIYDLSAAGAVLAWDHATYMPPAGAEARGRQGAILSRLVHERAVEPALGHLIDALAPYAETLAPEDRKSTRLNSSHLGISYAV